MFFALNFSHLKDEDNHAVMAETYKKRSDIDSIFRRHKFPFRDAKVWRECMFVPPKPGSFYVFGPCE